MVIGQGCVLRSLYHPKNVQISVQNGFYVFAELTFSLHGLIIRCFQICSTYKDQMMTRVDDVQKMCGSAVAVALYVAPVKCQ